LSADRNGRYIVIHLLPSIKVRKNKIVIKISAKYFVSYTKKTEKICFYTKKKQLNRSKLCTTKNNNIKKIRWENKLPY
jgi:hypothetical protein